MVAAEAVVPIDGEDSRHRVRTLPILLLFPHNRCNCRCLMCDIWKIRQVREITAADLDRHISSLRTLKVRWIVLSGGEPLLHSDLPAISGICRAEGIRLTLLTAGLLLERRAHMVAEHLDDVIASLDGPSAIHDRIRGVPRAFERLARGIGSLRAIRPRMRIDGRCTVQKENFRHLRSTVQAARQIGLDSVSFLAADVTSEAFNRPKGWPAERQRSVALDADEVEELADEVEALILDSSSEIANGFITEGPPKLRRIVAHFRANLGQVKPVSPRCNAPWVSAVVEADGTVRPCFFHEAMGNIQDAPLHKILNNPKAIDFRRHLDVATNPVCQKCACSLYLAREDADPQ